MGERRMVRLVALITPAQDEWLAAYEARGGFTNRTEAVRELLRRAMAGEAFFVDPDRTDGHTDRTGEVVPS